MNKGKFLSGLCHQALLLVALTSLNRAAAESTAITFTSRLLFYASGAGDEVIGWEFTPTKNLSVTKLGLYDGRPSGGFEESHVIGIWDSGAHLLGSAPMPLGETAPLSGSFRFVDAPSILLTAGQHYIIGAFMPAPVSDYFYDFNPGDSRVVIDPDINFVSMRVGAASGQITFPQLSYPDHLGLFGPDFAFMEVVPEPGVAQFGVAAAVFAMWRLRRARAVRRG